MKKLILALLFVSLVSTSVYANDCADNCDDPPYTQDTVTIYIPTNCSIFVQYEYRTLDCNPDQINEFRITGYVGVTNSSCAYLSFGSALIETAIETILGDPSLTPFPDDFPDPGECDTNYVVSQAACWENVWRPIGPTGSGLYGYPCDGPNCCKPYQVCLSGDGTTVTVASLPYTPQSCTGIIGDESQEPCYEFCP